MIGRPDADNRSMTVLGRYPKSLFLAGLVLLAGTALLVSGPVRAAAESGRGGGQRREKTEPWNGYRPGQRTAADRDGADWSASTYVLKAGGSLADVLAEAGFGPTDTYDAASALNALTDLRRLKTGQEVTVSITKGGLRAVTLPVSAERTVTATRDPGGWTAEEKYTEILRLPVVADAVVDGSLYAAGASAGIPDGVMMEAIGLFSFDVDFQRDIKRGDRFVLMYENLRTPDGEDKGPGDLLYCRLELEDRTVEAWRYERLDGRTDWYGADGASVRKVLLRTPVDGARVTSGYGMRVSPILGYSRMHQGIDFAAPQGTPVLASGDGTVEIAGWSDVYGNYVKLRHANHYETLYGHFVRIAPGIRPGVRVAQGQVIGYVGTTGQSTGPHCHYEVIYYGSHVNPTTLQFPPGHVLDAEDRRLFALEREAVRSAFDLR
jgi:murein DD-endopeptidase MepM/ murein hydrolase activator NlpD